jgi:hypothetical protein
VAERDVADHRIESLLKRLRQEGFSITTWDYARVSTVHVLKPQWRRGELLAVLQACLVRSPEGNESFERAYDEAFGLGAAGEVVFPTQPAPTPSAPLSHQLAEGPIRHEHKPTLLPASAREMPEHSPKRESPSWIMKWPKILGGEPLIMWLSGVLDVIAGLVRGKSYLLRFLGWIFACICALLAIRGAVKWYPPLDKQVEVDSVSVAFGCVTALVLMLFGAAVLDAWLRLRARQRAREANRRELPPPTRKIEPTDVVFRVGLIGNKALPCALNPRRGRDIADLFTYSNAGTDWRQPDIPATIRCMVTQPHESKIIYSRRRVLSAILILIDRASAGPKWNNLARDAEVALRRRGLEVTTIEFEGSFHRLAEGGMMVRTQEAQLIAAVEEDARQRVILLFTDANRMTLADSGFLAALKQDGPVLWFDYRDRHLWTNQVIAGAAGLEPWEATEEDLEAALRSLFSPRLGRRPPARETPYWRRPAASARQQALRTLGDAADWATDCAVLQPLSIGLADRLRAALHPHIPRHAFSRLLSLPGSMLGVEGLRFQSDIRCWLVQRFALVRDHEAQSTVTTLLQNEIDAARPQAPEASWPTAAWQWTRLQVSIMTEPDEALPQIDLVEKSGLLEPTPVRDFLSRIAPEGGGVMSLPADAIILPRPALSVAARKVLDARAKHRLRFPSTTWTVGPPLYRDEIEADVTNERSVFCADGGLFARIVPSRGGEPDLVVCNDLETGREYRIKVTEGDQRNRSDALVAIVGAAKIPRLLVATADAQLFLIDPRDERPVKALERTRAFDESKQATPTRVHLALSSRGELAAISALGHFEIRAVGETSDRSFPAAPKPGVTALAPIGDHDRFVLGFEDGHIEIMATEQSASRLGSSRVGEIRPPLEIAGPIVAIGVDPAGLEEQADTNSSADGRYATLSVIGTKRGDLHLIDLDRAGFGRTIRLGWAPETIEVFAGAETIAIAGSGHFDILDTELGVSALQPEQDDVTLRTPPRDVTVLAISDEGRRVAVTEHRSGPIRLEVRPLEWKGASATAATASEEAA